MSPWQGPDVTMAPTGYADHSGMDPVVVWPSNTHIAPDGGPESGHLHCHRLMATEASNNNVDPDYGRATNPDIAPVPVWAMPCTHVLGSRTATGVFIALLGLLPSNKSACEKDPWLISEDLISE